jgi:hypothetical protein
MGHETFMKRKKEMARQEKQMKKAARRLERREEKARGGQQLSGGEGPDIAGIRPGPQPKTY